MNACFFHFSILHENWQSVLLLRFEFLIVKIQIFFFFDDGKNDITTAL